VYIIILIIIIYKILPKKCTILIFLLNCNIQLASDVYVIAICRNVYEI